MTVFSQNYLAEPFSTMTPITPNDSNVLAFLPRALYVLTSGNLSIGLTRDKTQYLTIPVTAGQILPFQPKLIRATGTTATVLGLN